MHDMKSLKGTRQGWRYQTLRILFVCWGLILLGGLLPQAGSEPLTRSASAHNVDQRMAWLYFDDATLQMILARASANDLPLIRPNDELGIIVKSSPQPSGATTGVGGYIDFYVPVGTQVIDAGYVFPDGNGGYTDMPMKGQAIISQGAGPVGAKSTSALTGLTLGPNAIGRTNTAVDSTGKHRGTLAGVYGDVGIFYATDPETAWKSWNGGTITNNRGEVVTPNNRWDAEQLLAYGSKSPSSAIIDPDGRGSTPWGLGSSVAGPHSGYAWAFDKNVYDSTGNMKSAVSSMGPWQRIQYEGSTIADDIPGNPDQSIGYAYQDASTMGYALSPATPLPPTTSLSDSTSPKALRWSVGVLTAGRFEYARVKLKVLSSPDPRDANGCFNAHADVFGGDAGGEQGGKDHLWRYYDPTTSTLNPCALLVKRASNNVVANGSTFNYTIDFWNISASTQTGIQIQDLLPGNVEFISAFPQQTSGPSPLRWTIPSMAPGEKWTATVSVKAKSSGTLSINTVNASTAQGYVSQVNEGVWLGSNPVLIPSKRASPSAVSPGGTIQYTLEIDNDGAGPSGNPLQLTEYLPTGFSYVSLNSVTVNGANALASTTVNSSNLNRPVFTVGKAVNADQKLLLTFTARVGNNVTAGRYFNTFSTNHRDPVLGKDTTLATGTLAEVTVGGASIAGVIFRDWNNNGVQNASEEGIPGVTLTLDGSVTTVTGSDGSYLFNNVAAGNHSVAVTGGIPAGYTLTAGANPTAINGLAEGQNRTGITFGYRPGGSGSISGLIFEDKGNDSTYDSGTDALIANVTVNLYEDTNGNGLIGAEDALIATTASNGSGAYSFGSLATGISYLVDADGADSDLTTYFAPQSFLLTTSDPQAVPNLSGSVSTVRFGYFKLVPGSIGDQVFLDINANGIKDSGETLVPNVTLRLYKDSNANGLLDGGEPLLQSTSTSLTGTYTFNTLGPGAYIVDLDESAPAIPDGYSPSQDPKAVTLTVGQNRTDIDFGLVRRLSKAVNKSIANAGDSLTYTVSVNYLGGSLLNGVIITDTVPTGTTFQSAGQGGVLNGFVASPGAAGLVTGGTVANSVTISDAAKVDDTWINAASPTFNYGTCTTLDTDRENGGENRILVRFNLADIPAGATITSAQLKMTNTGGGYSMNNAVYRVTSAWDEGTQCGAAGTASWNNRQSATAWTTAGGDFNATAIDSANVTAAGQYNWNVTSAVANWVNNTNPNYGFVIYSPDGGGNRVQNWASSEHATASSRPQLVVSYTTTTTGSGNRLSVTPASLTTGATIQTSMALTATQTVNNVTPTISPVTLSGTASAVCSLTSASPQTVAAGSTTTFTWNCTASGAGTLRFLGNASGAAGYAFAQSSSDNVQVLAANHANTVTWNVGSNAAAVPASKKGTAYQPMRMVVTASKDAFITSGADAGKNWGVNAQINIDVDKIEHGLLYFPISASTLPAGSVLQSAMLSVTVESGQATSRSLSVRELTYGPWNEGTGSNTTCVTGVTWNAPKCTDTSTGWNGSGGNFGTAMPYGSSLGTIYPAVDETAYTANVSSVVNNWLNGGSNYGFVMLANGSDLGEVKFHAKDSGVAGKLPSVVLTYLVPQNTTASGVNTVTVSADTHVREDAVDKNFGIANKIETNPSNNAAGTSEYHGLLRFDLSMIPPGATINSATLKLVSESSRSNHVVEIREATRSWAEGGSDNSTCVIGATWLAPNCTDTSTAWNGSGGNFRSTPSPWGSAVYATVTPVGGSTVQNATVTALVQDWINGTKTNLGFAMIATGTDTGQADWGSREGGKPATLVVDWVMPPSASTGTALSTNRALVGTGDQIVVTQILTRSNDIGASGSVDVRINVSSDDAEQQGTDGSTPNGMYLISSDLELVRDDEAPTSGAQQIGLRFTSVNIPPGATVTNAYVRFRAITPDGSMTNSNAADLTIEGQAADNPTTFTSTASNISGRTRTSAASAVNSVRHKLDRGTELRHA